MLSITTSTLAFALAISSAIFPLPAVHASNSINRNRNRDLNGQNHSSIRRHRHRERAALAEAEEEAAPAEVITLAGRDATACDNGAWRCLGSQIQRCSWDNWIMVQNCTGENVICSSDAETTGCVWTWSVKPSSTTAAPINSAALPPASTTFCMAPVLAAQSSGAAGPTDEEECEDEDEDGGIQASGGPVPSAVYVARPSVSDGASAPAVSSSPDDDEECEEWETDSSNTHITSSSSTENNQASSISNTATPTSTPSAAAASIIGGNLAAHHDWYTQPNGAASGSPSGSSYDDGQWHQSSASYDDGKWSRSSPTNGWAASATSTNDWDQPSAAASSSNSWGNWDNTPSSTRGGKNSVSASASGAKPSKSASTGGGNNNTQYPGSWTAPHYVIYSDYWLHTMPDVSLLTSYNRFILAFWMSDRGAVDNAQLWEQFSDSYRQQIVSDYHAAGIAVMVSAFGSTDAPTMNNVDPTSCARDLANWVKKYGLDGVDIDYEDMTAMNTNRAEAWLITFQSELRNQLPQGQYLISHAPVAPWFTSGTDYTGGAYISVHKQTGWGIDFYNVQWYNQGDGVYEDCYSLIFNSGHGWPSTSVMELNSYTGIPLSKIVIGKPLDAGKAANGYMDPWTLQTCVKQAQAKGWNGGVMFWEWTNAAPSVMATVRG